MIFFSIWSGAPLCFTLQDETTGLLFIYPRDVLTARLSPNAEGRDMSIAEVVFPVSTGTVVFTVVILALIFVILIKGMRAS